MGTNRNSNHVERQSHRSRNYANYPRHSVLVSADPLPPKSFSSRFARFCKFRSEYESGRIPPPPTMNPDAGEFPRGKPTRLRFSATESTHTVNISHSYDHNGYGLIGGSSTETRDQISLPKSNSPSGMDNGHILPQSHSDRTIIPGAVPTSRLSDVEEERDGQDPIPGQQGQKTPANGINARRSSYQMFGDGRYWSHTTPNNGRNPPPACAPPTIVSAYPNGTEPYSKNASYIFVPSRYNSVMIGMKPSGGGGGADLRLADGRFAGLSDQQIETLQSVSNIRRNRNGAETENVITQSRSVRSQVDSDASTPIVFGYTDRLSSTGKARSIVSNLDQIPGKDDGYVSAASSFS